jgi:uncharacterized repeat protein (TIGR03809 family)
MTTSFDVSRYERALERWRVLAERRLEHMTELYETGRWRRYFSEDSFIGIVRETRAAVELWQRLAPEPDTEPAPVAQLFDIADEEPFVRAPLPSPFADQRSVA